MNELPQDINAKVLQEPQQGGQDAEAQEEIKMIVKWKEEAESYRKKYTSDWDTLTDYYNGKQWDDQKRAAYRAKPVLNIIRKTIQSQLPILTDNKPGFNVVASEPTDYNFAGMLGKLTQYWWGKNNIDLNILDVLTDAMIIDIGVLKITWDDLAEKGKGDVAVESIDPRDVFVSPESKDFNNNCKYVIHKIKRTVGEVKKLFPDYAEQITADYDSTDKKENDTSAVTLVSPIDKKASNSIIPKGSGQDMRALVELWECWMDDEALIEYEEEQDGQKTKAWKKQYPNGKLVTILPSKKLRLQSVENPYKHGLKPFVRFIDNVRPREFYCEGEARALKEQQRIINKTIANIIDYQTLMSNPIWIVEEDALDEPDKITNSAGMTLVVHAGKLNSLKRDIPSAMQAGSLDLYNEMLQFADMITGTGELSQGRRSQGDPTAGFAIVSLQEASQTRIRLKERNLQASLRQLGKQVINLMMQYYKAPRVVKITGEQGWPEYFEFFIEDTENGNYKINSKKYTMDESSQQYLPENEYSQSPESKGDFDVEILAGTSLPFAKQQRMNVGFKLFDSQVIDAEELLKTLEWPDREQILKRIQEKQAAMPLPPQGGQ